MGQNKLAIFVEGQTESIFIERLITELATARCVNFDRYQGEGGGASGRRRLVKLHGERHEPAARYYVQIVDSHTDNRVVSDIREYQANLAKQGFKAVLGIRDVYPMPRSSIPTLRATMARVLSPKQLPIDVILAVMEVEAWFLGEYTHLAKIGSGIDVQRVASCFGFDPSAENMEARANPAADLHNVYGLVGCAYQKTKRQIQRTVEVLDYPNLYVALPARMASLHELVTMLDRFLAV